MPVRNLLSKIKPRHLANLFLFAAIVMGVIINIRFLTEQSIRLDESQSIWITTRPLEEVLDITSTEVHMPLYYVILHYWLQIFSPSILAARSLSLLFLVLTIPLYYLLVKESSNHKVSILAVTLFILSPFVLWFSTEARMYSLFIFSTTLQNLFFLRFIRSNGKTSKLGYLLSTVFAIYTHYFFNFVVITQFIYIIYRSYRKILMTRRVSSLVIKYVLLTISAYLLALPWFIRFVIAGAGSLTSPLISTPTTYNIMQTFVVFLFGYQPANILSILISLWPVGLVFMFLVFTQRKRFNVGDTPYFFLILTLPIALGFIVSFVRPIFLSRYFIFVTPSLFFLMAWVLVNTTGKVYGKITIPILMAMLGFMLYKTISPDTPIKENYREVTRYLEKSARPQDIVVVTPPFTIYPVEYNYFGQARIATIPEWDRYTQGPIPQFSLEDVESMMNEYDDIYQNMYVVFSYNQGYEEDVRRYLDGHYHIIDKQIFSPDLYVIAYKLRYSQ